MLWTIVAILLVMWLLGLTVFHVGAIIHFLLVLAVIAFLVNLFTGRTTAV